MKKGSFIVIILLMGFASGFLGGIVSDRVSISKNGAFSQNSDVTKVVEERVYVEESKLIDSRKKVAPSVVSILAMKEKTKISQQLSPFDNFYFFGFPDFQPRRPVQPEQPQEKNKEPEKQVVSAGTGFIITTDGLALTNKHVVADDEAEYLAVMNDGTEYAVEVVSKDPLNDVAVVRIKEKNGDKLSKGLPAVELGDSDKLEIGQMVLAIGNALNEYENTTTAGIISATGRDIVASDSSGGKTESLSGLIQTDAAINPGNSGGPLINLAGQVVGINTAIDSQANGVSFAIPVNDVKPVLASIEKYGKIVRPILGVRYIILTEEKAKELGLDGVTHGAFLVGNYDNGEVAVIPDGPADKAGLQVEDVILEVDGKSIDKNNTLQQTIRNRQPGEKISLKVWRKGQELTFQIELGMSDQLEKK
ncbi:trypsin-like peptidase domain-containing protein [Candidatus Peregrinibacteria bacterium]|nr:trypsin-like peptidase domain-containing protein [Candidatus Peregrinibacteria bacterium]